MSRLSHSQALLGPELFEQIRETPVLVVGAGGIGCELRELLWACAMSRRRSHGVSRVEALISS